MELTVAVLEMIVEPACVTAVSNFPFKTSIGLKVPVVTYHDCGCDVLILEEERGCSQEW